MTGGPGFIGVLAGDFSGKIGGMIGESQTAKDILIFFGKVIYGDLVVLLSGSLLLTDDDMKFFGIKINLSSQTTNGHFDNFEGFFVGRDYDDVVNIAVFEPIGSKILIKLHEPIGVLTTLDFVIADDGKKGGFERLVEPVN